MLWGLARQLTRECLPLTSGTEAHWMSRRHKHVMSEMVLFVACFAVHECLVVTAV